MTNSRYVPRDFSDEPAGFGRAEILKWKRSGSPVDAARIQAATLQHRYSIRIRKRITDKLMTTKQFASESEMGYDRLMKVLRGELIMRLEDIAAADLILGEVSEFALSDANRARQVATQPR